MKGRQDAEIMREIKVRQNTNSCIIRWGYQGKSYSITWGNWDNRLEKARLEICGQMIVRDCLAEEFDTTLRKYKYWLGGINYVAPSTTIVKGEPLINLIEKRLREKFNSADNSLLRLLVKYGKEITTVEEAKEFFYWISDRGLRDTTRKRYLAILHTVRRDLFGGIKVKIAERPIPRPFTMKEVKRILEHIKDSEYKHYYSFISFLFNSGCRISEAIGLRWQDVDMDRREIHMYESLSRFKNSTSIRIRKSTKTGKYRIIPINNTLMEMFTSMKKGKEEDLIFIHKGKPINDQNIGQYCWKSALEELSIKHRPLKTTRSTFVSHCISSGMTVQETAAITGHDIKILIKHYLGSVSTPKLPEL